MWSRTHECSWQAVANPRHSLTWLCVEVPSNCGWQTGMQLHPQRPCWNWGRAVHDKVAWLRPFARATPWRGSVKTQTHSTHFSVVPQRRGHKLAHVLPALPTSRWKDCEYVCWTLQRSLSRWWCILIEKMRLNVYTRANISFFFL